MNIHMLNSDTELQRTFDSITTNPDQWKSWSCIHINDQDLQVFKFAKELLLEAERKLHIYLKGMAGHLFLSGFEDIYIFYESLEKNNISQLADNICDLINPDNTENIKINIYALYDQNEIFETDVVKTSCLYSPLNSALYCFDKMELPFESITDAMSKTRVLVVEDDPTTRWKFRKSLKGQCVLKTACDVNLAFGAYKQDQPDIVFLDLSLPDGSGYAVLEWILRNDPGAYIVICSGRDDIESKEKAMAFGAKGYITKPFKKKHLIEHIEACPKIH